MAKRNNSMITISENLREIDIIDDFWYVLKECRESYYYLLSLREILENTVVLTKREDHYEDNAISLKIKRFYKEISYLKNEFTTTEELIEGDGIAADDSSLTKEEMAIDKEQNDLENLTTIIEEDVVFDIITKSIYLREKIDKLQLNILEFLCDNMNNMNKSLIEEDEKLVDLYLLNEQKYLTKIIFEHSVAEDKIDTYKLNSLNNNVKKSLLKKDIKLPYYIKTKDYSYNLNKLRYRLDISSNLNMQLISMIQVIKKEKELEKLNTKQYHFNIIVIIFTVLSTLISGTQLILSLIY